MTDAGTRPQRPRKYAKPPRPKAPLWVVVVFIGVPSVLIVIMVGIIIKQRLFSGPAEPQAQEQKQQFDPVALKKEADALFLQARRLKIQAVEKQKEEKDYSVEFNAAMAKLKQAQQKYTEILERIKADNNGTVPEDYRGYEREITKIQQELVDTVKMKSFK